MLLSNRLRGAIVTGFFGATFAAVVVAMDVFFAMVAVTVDFREIGTSGATLAVFRSTFLGTGAMVAVTAART